MRGCERIRRILAKVNFLQRVCVVSFILPLLASVILVCRVSATTINVPADKPTIQSAINIASNGDTVKVAPGTYTENVNYGGRSIVVSGVDKVSTILQPLISYNATIVISYANAEFSNMTVRNGGPTHTIVLTGGTPVIQNCIFYNNVPISTPNTEVVSCTDAAALVINNIFYGNGGIGCVGLRSGSSGSRIISNTFDGNERGFFSIAGGGTAQNNIVTNSIERGIGVISTTDFSNLDYNNLYNNNPNYLAGGIDGPHDIHVDPQYVDIVNHDFSLTVGSPCIDAGNPAPQYNDPDGTRSDMGAIYAIQSYPYPTGLSFGAENSLHIRNNIPDIFWNFVDTAGLTQVAFEIEVGADDEWSVAENWQSGTISSTVSWVTYAGSPLIDGSSYYVRLRVYDGFEWSGWKSVYFHLNAPPTVPTPVSPTLGLTVPFSAVRLYTENSTDLESDPLQYEFEISVDFSFSTIEWQAYGVTETSDSTGSPVATGLLPEVTYYWRVRSYDGFDRSVWAGPESFVTRGPGLTIVPTDKPTIQAAINASASGDTVLVLTGVYTENIDYGGRSIIVLGEDKVSTVLQPINPYAATIVMVNASAEFLSMTVRDGGPTFTVVIDGGAPVIDNCIFIDNVPFGTYNTEVISCTNTNATITRNVFYGNGGIGCVGLRSGAAGTKIINNTFDSNYSGFFSIASGGIALNNIVSNSSGRGVGAVYPNDFTVLDYNDLYANNPDYLILGIAGLHDIHLDPLYLDGPAHNYSLAPGSPCIDAGDPNPLYNDANGSRSDIGALPISEGYPFAISINFGAEDRLRILNNTPTVFWTFADTGAASQSAFEIEIGNDNEWTVAELWHPGPIYTGDGSVTYAGSPLSDGSSYYLRIRLFDGLDWGEWAQKLFHLNKKPEPPVALSPVSGEIVRYTLTQLRALNSTDAENDALVYEFQVSSSASMSPLIWQVSGILQQPDATSTQIVTGLLAGATYYWTARASDGLENSDWSIPAEFVTRGAGVTRVPTDAPTIQAGIDLSSSGDTVIVEPGIYNENITYNGQALTVVGSGAENTTLRPAQLGIPTITIALASGIAEFSGFTVRDGGPVHTVILQGGYPVISNCIFVDNVPDGTYNTEVISCTGTSALITRNLFYGNGGLGCVGLRSGAAGSQIINNTFDQNYSGFFSIALGGIAINNIVSNSIGRGVGAVVPSDFTILDYNDLFANNPDYLIPGIGSFHDFHSDPLFVSPIAGDYHLNLLSPCIDVGNPDPTYNDSDGTRNDVGAYNSDCSLTPGRCPTCCDTPGDANNDNGVNIADPVFLIAYIFQGGPGPACADKGDANADNTISIGDVVYMINWIFALGPLPVCGSTGS